MDELADALEAGDQVDKRSPCVQKFMRSMTPKEKKEFKKKGKAQKAALSTRSQSQR